MKRRCYVNIALFVCLFLVSCASERENLSADTQTGTQEMVQITQAPTNTLEPTPSSTPTPTDTLVPTLKPADTATYAPTATPTATPIPTQTVEPPQIDPELKAWLQEHAIPFDTTVPESGFDDLQPLVAIIGDARIVALGEATHGTHEFKQMHHRLLEFLVQELDFNVFAVEASWADLDPINQYVQTGEGDPETLIGNLRFSIATTQEMLALIEWMRQYNTTTTPEDRIQFAGFDMQFTQPALERVRTFFNQIDPDIRPQVIPKLACANNLRSDYAILPQERRDACRENLQAVYDVLKENQTLYIERSSADEFANTLQSVRVMQQAEMRYGDPGDFTLRDRFMAENIAWLLDYYGANTKIVAWAHNGHVAAHPSGGRMGSFLRAEFNDEFISVGFEFGSGEFVAHDRKEGGLTRYQFPLPPKGSLADQLRAAEMPMFILDMRSATSGIAAEWLANPQSMHSIDAYYEPDCPGASFYSPIPAQTWDLLIYFENTTAAQYLGGSPTINDEIPAEQTILGPTNLGFEAGTSCWRLISGGAQDYLLEIDKTIAQNGENSLLLRSDHADAEAGEIWQRTDAAGMQGETVRMTVSLRIDELEGDIVLFFSEFANNNAMFSELVLDQNALSYTENSEWITSEMIVTLSEEAENMGFGVRLLGSGQIWIDDFIFEVVDS